jgi:hypothetical protein
MAAGALLPAGGAGGLGLGAFALRKLGMPGRAIAIRSSVRAAYPDRGEARCQALPDFLDAHVTGGRDPRERGGAASSRLAAARRRRILIFDVATLWLAFRALGSAPPFGAIAMGYLIGMLANMIPIPGGIGAVDFGLVGMLAVYGAPLTSAAAAVLIYRTISLWVPTLVGTVAYLLLRGDLRRPISPRRGSWPPSDQTPPPGRSANPKPTETAATPSASDAGPALHSDLPKPFNLAAGLMQATKERLP